MLWRLMAAELAAVLAIATGVSIAFRSSKHYLPFLGFR